VHDGSATESSGSIDVGEMTAFYASPLGRVVASVIGQRLAAVWPSCEGERVVGIGFAPPFLTPEWRAERLLALMPAALGVCSWPQDAKVRSTLVIEDDLPLPDASVDRVLMVHALEHAHDAPRMLREAWRVIAPGGRLVVIVPNRAGLWARTESTPFGAGQPYSRRQLGRLLENGLFTPTTWSEALFVPPRPRRTIGATSRAWEKLGSRFWPAFAGVILVDAEKRMRSGVIAGETRRRNVLVPAAVATRSLAAARGTDNETPQRS